MAGVTAVEFSCAELSVREVNTALRGLPDGSAVRIIEPRGRHNLAVGLTNSILHAPTVALREQPSRSETARELFGLDRSRR